MRPTVLLLLWKVRVNFGQKSWCHYHINTQVLRIQDLIYSDLYFVFHMKAVLQFDVYPSSYCQINFEVLKAVAPHSSTLAWKIPWMEEPGGPQSMGSLRVGQDSATSLSLFTFLHWRRQWQPTPAFLPRESQGWGSLVGCRLWDCTESDTTEATQQQQQQYHKQTCNKQPCYIF